MPCRYQYFAPVAVIVLIILWGCTSQQGTPGLPNGHASKADDSGAFFRHRWWNYYQRANSRAEDQRFDDAVSDLTAALHQRQADQRMARTYGMHFIDYFPNRELGLIYYELGDLGAAKHHLIRSIEQYPTAKAYFFLDQIRRELLKRSGRTVSPPVVAIKAKHDRIVTRDDPVTLQGVARDAAHIQTVTVNGRRLYMEGSQKEFSFTTHLSLPQGEHLIKVRAVNLAGKSAHRAIAVIVDRQGPLISLKHIRMVNRAQEGVYEIEGSVADPSEIASLRINSEVVANASGKRLNFRHLLRPGISTLHIKTFDRLGNLTEAAISLNYLADRTSSPLVAASDLSMLAGVLKTRDGKPPHIRLKGWDDTQTVYMDKVYIDGVVTDQNPIAHIRLNGHPVKTLQGRVVFFNQVVRLKRGVNTVEIETEDETGNRAKKSIQIFRRIPEAFQLSARLKLTVFPFEQGNTAGDRGGLFQDYLIDAILNQERFRVVERNLLEVILQEHRLSASKLTDRRTALNVGRLAAAQSLVAGRIIETRHGIEIVSRMIDTETSDILATVDVFGEEKSPDVLSALARGVALKYHREFPLTSGAVLHSDRDIIMTDLGSEEIKLQRRVIVYTEKPVRHPKNNLNLGMERRIVCQARVTQVMEQASKARILDEPEVPVQELFKVIAQ